MTDSSTKAAHLVEPPDPGGPPLQAGADRYLDGPQDIEDRPAPAWAESGHRRPVLVDASGLPTAAGGAPVVGWSPERSPDGARDHPSRWRALGEVGPDEPFVTYAEATAARLGAWESELAAREARLDARALEIEAQLPTQRLSLPAAPLAAALRQLQADPYLGGEDVATFAEGTGLDRVLVAGVLTGAVGELGAEDVARVCEGLRCSPYDLWGAELGRSFLHAYGPERWPAHIEPLGEGRSLQGGEEFVRRRLDQRVTDIVTLGPGVQPGPPGDRSVLEVTRYRQTGVIAVDAHGLVTQMADASQPADPASDYHFTFVQVGAPEEIASPLTPESLAHGCPAGHDAEPSLARLADRLDEGKCGTDMFRFVEPRSGAEQWLGRQTPFDPWQTWDDPRNYYPGDPLDVLDPGVTIDAPLGETYMASGSLEL